MANDKFLIEKKRRRKRRNLKVCFGGGGGSIQAPPNWHSIREDCLMSCQPWQEGVVLTLLKLCFHRPIRNICVG